MKTNTTVRLVLAASLLLSVSVAFVPTASAHTFASGGQCNGIFGDVNCTCTTTGRGCIAGQTCTLYVGYTGECYVG